MSSKHVHELGRSLFEQSRSALSACRSKGSPIEKDWEGSEEGLYKPPTISWKRFPRVQIWVHTPPPLGGVGGGGVLTRCS